MSKCSRESYNDAFTFLCTQSLLLALLQMLLNLQTRKNVSESQTGIELATCRAQNNGRSPDNDRPKMPLDWSHFYLTGHFDRPHLYAFR